MARKTIEKKTAKAAPPEPEPVPVGAALVPEPEPEPEPAPEPAVEPVEPDAGLDTTVPGGRYLRDDGVAVNADGVPIE